LSTIRLFSALLLLTISIFFSGCELKKIPKIGNEAPHVTTKSIDSRDVQITNKNEKITMIRFWQLSCPICVKEMPVVEKLYQKYSDKLDVVAINAGDSRSSIEKFVDKNHFTYKIVEDIDDKYAHIYGVVAVPISYVVDREGIVRDILIGEIDFQNLEKRLVALF